MKEPLRAVALIAPAGIALAFAGAARADDAADYDRVMKKNGAAIVSIKLVMKMKFGGEEHEGEWEISGLIIDPKGLILCSNDDLNPAAGIRRQRGSGGKDFSTVATDLKVLVGDDNEGVEAKIESMDSELDLAWVRIKEPKRTYDYVDFTKCSEARPGQRILVIHRLEKFYDRQAVISEGRVAAILSKPRHLLAMSGGVNGSGFPLFALDGSVVGFAVLQRPDDEDEEGGGSQEMCTILPAAEVVKATRLAAETVKGDSPGREGEKESASPSKKDAAKTDAAGADKSKVDGRSKKRTKD